MELENFSVCSYKYEEIKCENNVDNWWMNFF